VRLVGRNTKGVYLKRMDDPGELLVAVAKVAEREPKDEGGGLEAGAPPTPSTAALPPSNGQGPPA